ncbi:MAG: type II secretion system protein [Bacteriovoracaceae bacterium]
MASNNQNGVSLVGVMVAMGLVGGLAVTVMQVMSNMNQGLTRTTASEDELNLRTEIRMVLEDRKHCAASLSGYSIKKENIEQPVWETGEPVELWYGDKDSNRTQKRFEGTDTYGKLRVGSLELFMNNGTFGNYPNSGGSSHSDVGELFVKLTKPVSNTKRRDVTIRFPLRVTMETDASGTSVISSCSRENDSVPAPFYSSCNFKDSGTDSGDDSGWHTVTCGGDDVMSQFRVYASDKLDGGLDASCCKLKNEPRDGCNYYTSPTSGGSDDQAHEAWCGADEFMVGVSMKTGGSRLDGPVRVKCCKYKNISRGSCARGWQTNKKLDNAWHVAYCPSGMAMAGISFYATDRLDKIEEVQCCEVIDN